MIDIDKLLELESKATPGEWKISPYADGPADNRLIVEMRNFIRELCLRLKAAEEVVDIADRLAKYIEDEDDYRELRQAINEHEKVTGTGGEK